MNTAIKNKTHYYSHSHQQIKQHIPVNLPIKFRKKLLYNVFDQVWPWALTLIMFFWISSFRIEMFLNLIIHSNKNIERKYKYEMSTM